MTLPHTETSSNFLNFFEHPDCYLLYKVIMLPLVNVLLSFSKFNYNRLLLYLRNACAKLLLMNFILHFNCSANETVAVVAFLL